MLFLTYVLNDGFLTMCSEGHILPPWSSHTASNTMFQWSIPALGEGYHKGVEAKELHLYLWIAGSLCRRQGGFAQLL